MLVLSALRVAPLPRAAPLTQNLAGLLTGSGEGGSEADQLHGWDSLSPRDRDLWQPGMLRTG